MSPSIIEPLLCLAGPTASGKSAVAMELASQMNAEILVADSMQVYRGMDIATAKPTSEERAKIRHHGIDLVDPTEPYSVADWLREAHRAIADIHQRGSRVIVAGGTGLYLRALLHGLEDRPGTTPEQRLLLAQRSLESMVDELLKSAPQVAAGMDLKNRRRVERALAVHWQADEMKKPCKQGLGMRGSIYAFRRDREDLKQRIDQRVDRMFEQGLVGEYEKLLASGLGEGQTAWQALGYRQIHLWLKGEISENKCRDLLKIQTRQFARRQMTWFRKERGLQWLDIESTETPQETATRIRERIQTIT